MPKYSHIQKLQEGGTIDGVAAPLQSTEEVYMPQVNAELYFQKYELPQVQMPEFDIDRLSKVKGPENDVAALQSEVMGLVNTLNEEARHNPLILTTNRGKKMANRINELLTTGVNRVERQEDALRDANAYMKDSGNFGTLAMTMDGRYIARDRETGKVIKNLNEEEIVSGNYVPLTNMELAQLRRSHPDLVKDDSIYTTVTATTGMEKVAKALEDNFVSLGEIEGGGTDFFGVAEGEDVYTKSTWKNRSNAQAIAMATRKLYMKLSAEQKNTLRANAFKVLNDSGQLDGSSQAEIADKINDTITGMITYIAQSHSKESNVSSASIAQNPYKVAERENAKAKTDLTFTPLGNDLSGGGRMTSMVMGNGFKAPAVEVTFPDKDAQLNSVLFGKTDVYMQSDRSKMVIQGLGEEVADDTRMVVESYGMPRNAKITIMPTDDEGRPIVEFSPDKTLNAEAMSDYKRISENLLQAVKSDDPNKGELVSKYTGEMSEFMDSHNISPSGKFSVVSVAEVLAPAVGQLDPGFFSMSKVAGEIQAASDVEVNSYRDYLAAQKKTGRRTLEETDKFYNQNVAKLQIVMPINAYNLAQSRFALGREVTDKHLKMQNPTRPEPSGDSLKSRL